MYQVKKHVKLLGKQQLQAFILDHSDARSEVESWIAEVERAQWHTPIELKSQYPKASILKSGNVIFNLCWNKYRVWARVNYKNQIALIMKVGTHKEYDKWRIE